MEGFAYLEAMDPSMQYINHRCDYSTNTNKKGNRKSMKRKCSPIDFYAVILIKGIERENKTNQPQNFLNCGKYTISEGSSTRERTRDFKCNWSWLLFCALLKNVRII